MRPRTILYTGKGGVGKTSVAACTARRCAAAGPADARHLDRSGPQPVRVAGGRARRPSRSRSADRLWGQEVKAQEEMERHWSGVQEWLGELLQERGVDRISAEELTVPPGMDELFSLLRLQAHNESGRVGRDRRRLRADRRDAAAAVVPRRRPLVDRQGVPVRAPDPRRGAADRPLAARHLAARPGRVRRHRAAVAEPDRDERDPARPRPLHDPAGDEPRQDGDRRGDADVHLPEPVRLSDRRRDRQPHVPGRRRRLLRRLAPGPGGAPRARAFGLRAGAGPVRAVLRAGGGRAPRCSTGWPTRCSASATRARCCTTAITQELEVVRRGGAAAARRCRSPSKGDISLKKIGLELIVGVDGQQRTIMLPPALAAFRPTGASVRGRRAGGAIRWQPQEPEAADPSASDAEALARLEERLERASEAAERLSPRSPRPRRGAAAGAASAGRFDEPAAGAGPAGKPPPAGPATPRPDGRRRRRRVAAAASSSCCSRRSRRCATGSRPISSGAWARRCARCCWRCGR